MTRKSDEICGTKSTIAVAVVRLEAMNSKMAGVFNGSAILAEKHVETVTNSPQSGSKMVSSESNTVKFTRISVHKK